jgi:hypothetical protein
MIAKHAVVSLAVGSGLLVLAGLTGCFRSIDREDVNCQIGDPTSCPDGYECRPTDVGPKCRNLAGSGGAAGTAPDASGSGGRDAASTVVRDGAPKPPALDGPADIPVATIADAGPDTLSMPERPGSTGGRPGVGGSPGSGGRISTGGMTGRGGALGRGGAIGTGGATGAGGLPGTGGRAGQGGMTGMGGVTLHGTNVQQTGGSTGFARRAWDCCQPTCAGKSTDGGPIIPSCGIDGATRLVGNEANSCYSGGPAYLCYDYAPWYDANTNLSYGFAYAVLPCGGCYLLQFTGEGSSTPDVGAQALKGQQMIVMVIGGYDNSRGEFDLLVPGQGRIYSQQSCTTQWNIDPGAATDTGGLLTACSGDLDCVRSGCSSTFGFSSTMKIGCDWYADWFSGASSPKLTYRQVTCPAPLIAVTQGAG